MRFVAACGIVWIHTVESDPLKSSVALGRFAVPFFTVASIWLLSQSLRRKPELKWTQYAASRTVLLYGSFLLWNAIYFLARWLKHRFFHAGMPLSWNIAILWVGVAEQLWFLPVLLVASLVAFPIFRAGIGRPRVAMMLAILFAILAVLACFISPPPYVRDPGTNSVVRAVYYLLPAVLASISVALINPTLERVLKSPVVTAAAIILFAITSYVMLSLVRSPAWEAAGGLSAFVVCFTPLRAKWIDCLGKIGAFAMGIYLSHVLWVELLQAVAHRPGHAPAVWLDFAVAIASVLLALLTSFLLRGTILVPR